MILNIKNNTLDGKKIGDIQTKTLSALANNYCISYEELSRFVYRKRNCDGMANLICSVIYILRHKGLHIERKNNNGYRLIDEIYIDY